MMLDQTMLDFHDFHEVDLIAAGRLPGIVDRLQRPSDPQRLTGLWIIQQFVRVVLQSDRFAHLVCQVRNKFARRLYQIRRRPER